MLYTQNWSLVDGAQIKQLLNLYSTFPHVELPLVVVIFRVRRIINVASMS